MPNNPSSIASTRPTRRVFLSAAVGGAAAASLSTRARGQIGAPPATAPWRKVVVAVIGASRYAAGGPGRGTHLATTLAKLPGVEIACICDVDEGHVAYAIDEVTKVLEKDTRPPRGVSDLRRVFDDKSIDAVAIATPDHWHAPAAILACAADKHVYVEKPCCHNPHEGELLLAAAKKYGRVVQHGTQRRTWPAMREAVERLRSGEIGRVIQAKTFYYSGRGTIGNGKAIPVPQGLDWALWQGPAPQRPFHDNYLHYTWHWFWHWGTGELGNNGVHFIDQARWGLGVDYPTRVTFAGGKYRFPADDQETPDTGIASFEFGDKLLTWEFRSWGNRSPADPDCDVMFIGETGNLVCRGGGYTILDPKGKQIAQGSGESGDSTHLNNFIQTIRGDATLHAPIEEGFKSALLCNLGNISFRTGRAIQLDAKTQQIAGDRQAAALWRRDYQPGWEPKV